MKQYFIFVMLAMAAFVVSAEVSAGVVVGKPEQRVRSEFVLTQAQIEKCARAKCFVLTEEELIAGLQKASSVAEQNLKAKLEAKKEVAK